MELTVFSNEKFGEIRTVEIDGNVWFVGKDVATALGYSDTKQAISVNVDSEDKMRGGKSTTPAILDANGHSQYPVYINESGVYALIFGSKLESAKEFKHWVTSEVLPTLRKTGTYTVQSMTMDDCMKIIAQSSAQIASAISALSVQTQTNTVQLQDNTSRIEQLEKKFEEKTKDIAPDLPPKEHIIALIRNRANKTKENYNDLYRKLYSDYGLRTHSNPAAKAKKSKMTTISFIEKEGDIKLLLAIAEKLFGFGA